MRKVIFLFLFAIFSNLDAQDILVHEAFLTRYTEVSVPNSIPVAPPAPFFENVPPRPSLDEIWIPGYWTWIDIDNKYSWVCGVWRRPPPNLFWISGVWVQNPNGWVWARGFWSPAPFENLSYIPAAPPQAIDDNVPPSPGNNYFWIPGYWDYALNTKNYGWLSGKWEIFNQSWILTPSSYYWRPQGYVFVPIFWDWPLEARGHVFSCDNGIALTPDIIVQHFFFFYPDYHIFYWHWWHFHPGWGWDGCGCIPPWWFWDDWWAFGWGDAWGLWWWWGHPGFFPPIWLSLELSLEIAPPPLAIIEVFDKIKKPPFLPNLGDKPLLPKGPEGSKTEPTKPHVPNDVKPIGPVKLPAPPEFKVTPPTVTPPTVTTPPLPPNSTPPVQIDNTPSTPNYTPPQNPNYIPPQNPNYIPPQNPNYTPPQRPNYTPPQKPNYVPPSTYYPPTDKQPNNPRIPPTKKPPYEQPPTQPPKNPPSTRNPVTPPSKSGTKPLSNTSPTAPSTNKTSTFK